MEKQQRDIHISSGAPVPNAVDIYDSYTYNITFSMLPNSFWHTGKLPIGNNAVNKIIVAQTGVTTKFNIDNLTIETVNDNYGSTSTSSLTYTTKATFEITEPLGSSLISLMQRGYGILEKLDAVAGNTAEGLYDKDSGPLDLLYLMEVDLIGHRGHYVDGDEMAMFDAEGPVMGDPNSGEIFGKYAWPVYLTQFDFRPETEGTKYMFETVSVDQYVKMLSSDTRKIQNDFNIYGEDIEELFQKFGAEVTKQIVSAQSGATPKGARPDPKRCHVVTVKLGNKCDGETKDTPDTSWHEDAYKIVPGYLEEITVPVTPAEGVAKGGDGDTEEKTQKINVLKMEFKEGESITKAIDRMLSHSQTYTTLTTDKIFDGANADKIKDGKEPGQPTYSSNIHATLLSAGETTYTGGPAYQITYNVDLKQQAGAVTEGNKTEDTTTQTDIIDNWFIVKKYDYMFSGLNDQVLDVDISYPNGQIFLFPEHGGLGPTYRDSPATAANTKAIAEQKDKSAEALAQSTDAAEIIKKFEELQLDLQSALSSIKMDGMAFIEGLQAQVKGPANALKSVNGRLPSSPASVFNKIKVIESTTQFFDNTFNDLVELQQSIEESANDFASGINLTGRISEIVKKAASPFDFVTESISGGLGSISTGIDGFVDTINESTGLTLSPNDIPGIGEAQRIVDTLTDAITTPGDGFGTGTIGGGNTWNTTLTSINVQENKHKYLEELDFNNDDDFAPAIKKLKSQPHKTGNKEEGKTVAQHYFSTVLSYSGTGIPYLNKIRLSIKGDPYWIGRKNYVNEMKSGDNVTLLEEGLEGKMRWRPEFQTDRSDTTSAPYDAGSVFFGFRYLFPKEYEHYQDDPSLHTGKMEFDRMDLTYSGYYMVVKTTHSFVQGQFRQDIDAVKMNTYPNNVVFADGTIINTDPDAEKTTVSASNIVDDGSTTDALKFTPTFDDKKKVAETVTTAKPIDKEQDAADRRAFLDGFSTNPGFDPNDPGKDIDYLDPDFDWTQTLLNYTNGGG